MIKRKELSVDHGRRLLTKAEAAASLGIGQTKLYHLLKEGKIAYRRLGKLVMIQSTELDRFVETLSAD